MKISARNVFTGKISKLTSGAVNAEVEITTNGGDKIVSIVTESSVAALGLSQGKEVKAFVKAPWVILITGGGDVKFSARNQLSGEIVSISKGAVNSEVALRLPGGNTIHAVITNEATTDLGLAIGAQATALIKASHVILGIPA